MSFWGKLFGTEKALDSVVKGVTNGLDALVYTEEEREKYAAADRSEARKMVVEWMTATQGQNLARRLLSLAIGGVWLFMYVTSSVLGMAAIFTDSEGSVTAAQLTEAGKLAREAAVDMNPAVMLILAFYFAAPHMGDVAKAVTGSMTRSTTRNKG